MAGYSALFLYDSGRRALVQGRPAIVEVADRDPGRTLMAVSPFERAVVLSGVHPELTAEIPDGWQQGRGAFGGVVMALMARAAIASESDPSRKLRTFTADLCAPVMPGPARLEATHLRRGKRMTNVDVRMLQADTVIARASVALGSDRAVEVAAFQPPAPTPPSTPWADVAALPIQPPMGPVFAEHFEYRNTGPLPFSGGKQTNSEGFVRPKGGMSALDTPLLIGMLDVWWPAFFSVLTTFRAAATVTFTAEVHADPSALDPAQPLFYRGQLHSLRDGYTTEFRELWSGETLLASNQQTMAMF